VSSVSKVRPSSGEPCPPFYRPRGEQGLQIGERGKYQGYRRSFEGSGSFFFPRLPCITWQTVSETACLIFVGHALASLSKWVRPVPPPRAACRTGVSICNPVGSGWRGDCSFATVEDGSPPWNVVVVVCLCRVLRPRAEGGAYNTVGQKVRAHNTIQPLPRLEGSKSPSCHVLMALSCRGAGHGPRCRG